VAEEIVPAIRKLGQEQEIHLIDLYEFFKKRPELLPGVHPGKEGYRAMAEFIFTQIRLYLNNGAA
jgi:lysophospholipase L1-like esterase